MSEELSCDELAKSGSLEEIEPSRKKILARDRATRIKLVSKYFACSYILAQAKYSELKEKGELDEILEKAGRGERVELPICPICGFEMHRRLSKNGEFWGCVRYPDCRGTRPIKSEMIKITKEKKKLMQDRLALTMKYIEEIGGVEEARNWIALASQAMVGRD